jgi:hypothetical protein
MILMVMGSTVVWDCSTKLSRPFTRAYLWIFEVIHSEGLSTFFTVREFFLNLWILEFQGIQCAEEMGEVSVSNLMWEELSTRKFARCSGDKEEPRTWRKLTSDRNFHITNVTNF